METAKILFILKRREDYNHEKHSHIGLSTGLYNSATFMAEMLKESGFETNVSIVLDNNEIDREVTKFKPTHVIIEALWVVPTKFSVLCKLHPNVKWIIRLHSEIPFLGNEGMAFDWLGDYVGFKNIIIGANAPRALQEVRYFLKDKLKCTTKEINKKVVYLPNYYPITFSRKKFNRNKEYIDISCFGAIRPLKNHVLQALAAIKFADKIGKKLRFHINSGRIEQQGNSVLSNLKSIFTHLHENGHQLINHEWSPRNGFLEICKKMDIGMQVSISETFNIVGADIISQGVPLVGSSEIPWANSLFNAKPVDGEKIYESLLLAYYLPNLNVMTNQLFLKLYVNKTKRIWTKLFKDYEKI
jgi:hypothetical protein